MRVEIRQVALLRFKTLGVVTLIGDKAVPDEGARAFLEHIRVVQPGNPRQLLTYDDGISYLNALQHSIRGTYVWATSPLE
jgi:hypothetical protein